MTALAFPSLQTINAAVLFELASGMSLDLPALTNFDGTGSGFDAALNVPDNGTVTAGVLVTVDDVDISLGDGGTLNVPNLGTYTRGTLTLGANQTVSSGPLVNIDGSRFILSGGASFSVAATSYDTLDFYSSGDFFVATGASTVLDMSSVQSLNFDHDVGGAPIRTIAARDSGTLDLSGVTDIVGAGGGDSLRLEVAAGGTLDFSGLQTISGNRNVRITSDGTALAFPSLQTINAAVLFELAPGMSLDLPSLTNFDGTGSGFSAALNVPDNGTVTAGVLVTMDDVDISLGDGGTLNVPNLGTYTRGTLTLGANQTLDTGPLVNTDGSRFVLSGGASISVAATAYDTLDFYSSGDFFAATGASTLLDMSSVQSLNFDQDFGGAPVSTIAARNDGHVDLSGVVDIVGPRGGDFLELCAESGGLLDLSSLMTTSQNVRFNVNSSGQLRMGSMLGSNLNMTVTDVGSSVEVTGSWNLGPTSSLTVSNGGEVAVAGNFGHQQTSEAAINLNAATLRMNGIGGQLFEAASEDLGLGGPMAGNFGTGQLVIGQTAQRTSVDLIDVVDNGNRGATGTEALYLFGLGGPDGLRILNDSALILNGINVYAWDAATTQMVHINDCLDQPICEFPMMMGLSN